MRNPPVPCPRGVRAPVPSVFAAQNDAFRHHVCNDAPFPAGMPILDGGLVISSAIRRVGLLFVLDCMKAVGEIEAFPAEADPCGFRDRGATCVAGRTVWFVIDHYDREMKFGSPAHDDPALTSRVLTILSPSDY
ncbi:DUF3768 domain-containing protein [uncultured Jannaschia sp.]|uniref:DUF3768 domain-containing protein n=1 Tax=uncultured Jannaschia sp. TaxID=293347 RepID=UPI00263443A6|nr:DUF3768 domain-containing protein [uncultured Jannaschia sp.]